MKITNLKINNFGKLSNKEIELKDGINIIYGENESGKSTLLKFIIGMFYGLSKNKNGKPTSDYEVCTPWNEGEFSGKIKYKLDNEESYEVFREFKKKNPIIYNQNLEDISSTFNQDKTAGNKFFYDQTKVDEELFTSTIVSLQNEVKLEEKEQQILVQKISNLASTGEDNLSFQKIINKLNKRQMEEIGTTRSQDRPINVVTKRLQQIQTQKEYLSNFATKKYEIGEQKENLEAQIKEDENKLELLKSLGDLKQKQEIEKEKIKINENALKEYKEKIQKLENDRRGINDKNINEQNEKKALIKKIKLNKEKTAVVLSIIFLILSLLSIFVIKNDIITAIGIVLFIVTLIFASYTKYKVKLINNKNKDIKDIENSKIKNEIEVLEQASKKLEAQLQQEKERIQKEYKEETEKLRNKYIGLVPIKTIDEILQKESVIYDISTLQNKITNSKVSLHSNAVDLNNILPQMENLSALEEESTELETQYQELIKKNDLINLAKEEIEKAYTTMKNNITPKFTSNLSEIIQKISARKI